MEEKIRAALKNVPDAYDDFVNYYTKEFRGQEDKQKQLLEYLVQNPTAQTDEVMIYVDDVLLNFPRFTDEGDEEDGSATI